jgi:hypothetical protein
MEIRDLFVAAVALTIGGIMIYAAILNEGWCFQMKIARAIAESKGRDKARSFIGSVGSLMVLIGLYLLLAPLAFSILQHADDRARVQSHPAGTMSFAESD